MKCLKCPQDALPGKALCAACFERHNQKESQVQSEEWVEEQLKRTRHKQRARTKTQENISLKGEMQNAFMRAAPFMIILGALFMWGTWYIRSGGFHFVSMKSATKQGSQSSISIEHSDQEAKLGTSGMERLADESIAAVESATEDDLNTEDLSSGAVTIETPTPTPTPTATPTMTPTATPTVTPTSAPA